MRRIVGKSDIQSPKNFLYSRCVCVDGGRAREGGEGRGKEGREGEGEKARGGEGGKEGVKEGCRLRAHTAYRIEKDVKN